MPTCSKTPRHKSIEKAIANFGFCKCCIINFWHTIHRSPLAENLPLCERVRFASERSWVRIPSGPPKTDLFTQVCLFYIVIYHGLGTLLPLRRTSRAFLFFKLLCAWEVGTGQTDMYSSSVFTFDGVRNLLIQSAVTIAFQHIGSSFDFRWFLAGQQKPRGGAAEASFFAKLQFFLNFQRFFGSG